MAKSLLHSHHSERTYPAWQKAHDSRPARQDPHTREPANSERSAQEGVPVPFEKQPYLQKRQSFTSCKLDWHRYEFLPISSNTGTYGLINRVELLHMCQFSSQEVKYGLFCKDDCFTYRELLISPNSSSSTTPLSNHLVARGEIPLRVYDLWLGTLLAGDNCSCMLGSKQYCFFLLLLQSVWHEEVSIRSSALVFVGLLCRRSVGVICVFAQKLIQCQVMVTYFIQYSTTCVLGLTILLSDEFKRDSMLLQVKEDGLQSDLSL